MAMNFQEVCRELEKWAGKTLEPIILDEYKVFALGETLRHRFTPGDTGMRKARLDWDRAEAFVQHVKRQAEPDVRLLHGAIRIGCGSGRRPIGIQIRHPLLGAHGCSQ